MNKLRLGVGLAAIVVGLARLYITVVDSASGQAPSMFGLATGVLFAAMGAWFTISARATR